MTAVKTVSPSARMNGSGMKRPIVRLTREAQACDHVRSPTRDRAKENAVGHKSLADRIRSLFPSN